ncbi:hypothetical protein Tco_1511059, partial [Tanacetum coccineum]
NTTSLELLDFTVYNFYWFFYKVELVVELKFKNFEWSNGAFCTQGTVSLISIIGSISSEGFLSLILLLVVIIALVVIVEVVIVVVVIRVVVVVGGVSFIIKLSFMVIVDLTGDEDLTDEDGDTGMGDSTGVSVSLGLGGKKFWELSIRNIRDEGKTGGGSIETCGGIGGLLALYAFIKGLS